MKIYPAGPFIPYKEYEDWRDFLKEKAPKHDYHDPRFDSDQYAALTFTNDDLIKGVELSDLVFTYHPKNAFDVIGFSLETGDAFGKRIPIVLVDENIFIYPMLGCVAKRTFTNLEWAVRYINYLESMDKESEAIDKILKEIRNEDSNLEKTFK